MKRDLRLLVFGGRDYANRAAVFAALDHLTVPAAWSEHGRRAGPLRNRRMVELGPDAAVQFPGGRGTADMRAVLEEAGVPVWEPTSLKS